MLRLLWQELVFRRNGIIGWSLGLCFFPLVYLGIYPQMGEDLASMQTIMDLEIYQVLGISFNTLEEWIGSTIILLVPLLLSIYAVADGTGTLAGEEEDGRLETIVTLPLPRWQVVTAKALAIAIALFVILLFVSLVTGAVFMGVQAQVETDLRTANVITGLLTAWPLPFAVGMISLFLSAFASSRRIAAIIAGAILAVSYFGNNLVAMSSSLEPFEPFFLFSYLDTTGTAVTEGQQASDMLILLAIGLVAFGLAVFFFQRRNLTVGSWPWQRGRAPT